MNYKSLYSSVTCNDDKAMIWLMNNSLLANGMNCKKCNTPCRIVTKKDAKVWRCPQKGCQAVISIRNGVHWESLEIEQNCGHNILVVQESNNSCNNA